MLGSITEDVYFDDDGVQVYAFKNLPFKLACDKVEEKIEIINNINKIDIIEITDSRPLIKSYKKIPIVMRLHTSLSLIKYKTNQIKNMYEIENQDQLYYHLAMQLSDSFAGVSNFILKSTIDFHKIKKDKIYGTIYNGLNINEFPLNKGKRNIIFNHGTLGDHKGTDQVCKVFRELYKKDKTVSLKLIGRGKEYFNKKCKEILKESNAVVEHNINISKKELIQKCSNYGIYLSLSKMESFGLAMLEAMALGKPVIVSNIECFKEIIEDGKEGYIVDREKTDDIIEKIEKLISDEKLYNEMSSKARERAKRFIFENTVEQSIKWYYSIIKNKNEVLEKREYVYEQILRKILNNETYQLNDLKERENKEIIFNKILFLDNIHFGLKSFPILHEYIKANKIPLRVLSDYKNLKSINGDWEDRIEIQKYKIYLNDRSKDELIKMEYKGIELYPLCRDELLSYLLTSSKFHELLEKNREVDLIYHKYKEYLIANMAAAMFWIDYYEMKEVEIQDITHVLIFGGCKIYMKAFIKLIEKNKIPIKIYISENLFTGRDFYFEKRNTPIPNNSNIYLEEIEYDHKYVNIALEKIKNQKNLNVKQPTKPIDDLFDSSNETILLLGQVINDYSLISSKNKYLSSINFYKELIKKVLNKTNYNIIIKTHPFEKNKLNLIENLTDSILLKYLETLDGEFKKRVKVIQEYNIFALYNQSKFVVTICSQGALESVYYGKKPVIFGNAFYGKKGFTYDYEKIDEFLMDLKAGITGEINYIESQNFKKFIGTLFSKHLVSDKNIQLLSTELTSNIGITSEKMPINNSTNKEIELLSEKLKKSERKVEALQNSKSWKITSPIRKISSMYKKYKKKFN